MTNEEIKRRTQEIYDSLPPTKEERIPMLDVRDEIVTLNYKFICYIGAKTHVVNNSVSLEDRQQSAFENFNKIWWRYGLPKYKDYRNFTSFFFGRINEMIKRDLNDVKNPDRRKVLMKIGEEVGKHWGKVVYEDIAKCKTLSYEEKQFAGAILQPNMESIDTYSIYNACKDDYSIIDSIIECDVVIKSEDDIINLLQKRTVELESKLTYNDLVELSTLLNVPFNTLNQYYDVALAQLYKRLKDSQN